MTNFPSSSTFSVASFVAPQIVVDIIVPVYLGLDETRRCLDAVLSCTCRVPFRLIVINDESPDESISEWLRRFAATDARIMLLENPENLGFVGTANRGMACSNTHDVVLLNSDAQVANDWLDRLHRTAYQGDRIASVTPFSNNATICSYPNFCEDNLLPADATVETLDAVFARINRGSFVEVPTAVGFCMYIRREVLNEVGLFDVVNFGKGYGEENDFCCRAAAAGWRHLHALDVFVYHAGGLSFGDSKGHREWLAMETLRRLHPAYDHTIRQFLRLDPARKAREAIEFCWAQAHGNAQSTVRKRRVLLALSRRLRSLPILSWLGHQVPFSWRKRIRSWLT